MGTELTKPERKELTQYEDVIARGSKTFIEVGNALAAIRDAKLYRAEFETFEKYCHERWDFTKTQANRLIGASNVTQALTPIGVILPATESQARPLTTIDMEEVGDCWQEVIETAEKDGDGKPKITAKHVEETVKAWKAADEKYVEPKEYDFSKEADAIEKWIRARAQHWPNEYREAFSKLLLNLSKEVK